MVAKVDGVWAENGALPSTPITDEKKDAGHQDGDQPTVETFNYLQNRTDLKLNELAGSTTAAKDTATVAETQRMIASGKWDLGLGISEINNKLSTSTTNSRLCTVFDSDGSPFIVSWNYSTKLLVRHNPRTLSIDTTYDPEAGGNLPASASGYTISNMASDGDFLYCVFEDDTTNSQTIQAFNTETWTVKTGWPTTGTTLTGTGSGLNSQVIVASDTLIAVAASWVTITSSSSAAIQLIQISDGLPPAGVSEGAGNAQTTASAQPYSLCSESNDIYFSYLTGGAPYGVAKAPILDLTSSSGSPVVYASGPVEVLSYNDMKISVVSVPTGSSSSAIAIHTLGPSVRMTVEIGEDSNAVNGTKLNMLNVYGLCSDGLNLWILCTIENITASGEQTALTKIPLARFSQSTNLDAASNPSVVDIATTYLIDSVSATSLSSSTYTGICFDGRDVWATIGDGTSRLPLVFQR